MPAGPAARGSGVVGQRVGEVDHDHLAASGRSLGRGGTGALPGETGELEEARDRWGRGVAGPQSQPLTGWTGLLEPARQVFGAPSFAIFTDLLTGWVLAPGRRTVTAMITVADPAGGRAHDAYHRFLRDGVWNLSGLWRLLATHAVTRFAPSGVVSLDCDDTLFHKNGRNVVGAGNFRDAVRSTGQRVVYALGLNLVVVTLRITPSWGSMPIALPVNARLHKKKDPITTVEHATQMMRELAN